MKNELAGDIGLAAGKSQYDAQCKRVLANKVILAWILKYTVKEFRSMSIRQIKKCIGNDILISKVRVEPGNTNVPEPEKIIGESEEDKVPGEGGIYFDIRFSVYLPEKNEKIKMLINVEAQKGIEFSGSDYDKIKKVYSIWICMNAPDYIGNAVSEYSILKTDHIPGIPDQKSAYDKISVVQICLNPKSEKGNRLTEMLNVLLSTKMKVDEKIKILEEDFQIPMEREMGKELNQMCNLSDYVEEIGIKKGIEKLLTEQVMKKIEKGKTIPEIADALEEDEETIRRIVESLSQKQE